ncbi:MAG TPA: GNAT family N-acetyltransferase [Thermoplasmata archaeon]|nr:GNAT family N-acetyltransferase [Thermoplasmata archaeon]
MTESQGRREPAASSRAEAPNLNLRRATAADVKHLVPLIVRLKRLNEEFDPMLKVRDDVEAQARERLEGDLENPNAVVLAAEGTGADRGKIVGVVRAQVRERPFYEPKLEGVILDIYLLPLYRRHGAGEHLLAETTRYLKELGAGIVTADFPTQNEIAARFYAKRGFRPVTALHARSI